MHCVHLKLWITVVAHKCYESLLLVCIALKNSRTKILCSRSWMPGIVASLHHSRSPLISQHDDSAVLFFVGYWVWGNLNMERKLCVLAALGRATTFFHFAIAIKMKLQIRWDFCLGIGARIYVFQRGIQHVSPVFTPLSLWRQENFCWCPLI